MGHATIDADHAARTEENRRIRALLRREIDRALPDADARIWHAHPVWFLDGNPIVGDSRLKAGMRLMFWSGQSFPTPGLTAQGKVKAAELRIRDAAEIDTATLAAWLADSRRVQWDDKAIVKRKGQLDRLR